MNMDALRMIGSLVLVFGLLGAVLWGLKRLQQLQTRPGQLGARRLQVLESHSVGPRQKIALVRVGAHEVLVGVSPGQITALGQWPVEVVDGEPAPLPAPSFLQEMRRAL
jgi:flagellar protein FliO/FliZ